MNIFCTLGLILLSSISLASQVSDTNERLKYPDRDIYKDENRKPAPSNLRINWSLLGLYETEGKDCLGVSSNKFKNIGSCVDKGYEEKGNGSTFEAREYFRTSCREVTFDDNFSSSLSTSCKNFIELGYDKYSDQVKTHLIDLYWAKCKLTKGKSCSRKGFAKGRHKAILTERVCFKFTPNWCEIAAYEWLPYSIERTRKNFDEYCKKSSLKSCGYLKKGLLREASEKGIKLLEKDFK